MWQSIAGHVPRNLCKTVPTQLFATNGPAKTGSAFTYCPNASSFVRRWPDYGGQVSTRATHIQCCPRQPCEDPRGFFVGHSLRNELETRLRWFCHRAYTLGHAAVKLRELSVNR